MKEICEKHGLTIVSYRGDEPYCDECHIEDIKLQLKGHTKDTIARWEYKNAILNSDTWPSNKQCQIYTLDMLMYVETFGLGFYDSEIFEKGVRRWNVLSWELEGMSWPDIQDKYREKYNEDLTHDFFDEVC